MSRERAACGIMPRMDRAVPVRVCDVRKMYGVGAAQVVALNGVSLTVERGEMVALVGPSGCGKSTLLNLIGCIDVPTSGEIYLDGQAVGALKDDALTRVRRDRIGTIFQFFNLLPAMTVAENVALPLLLQGAARPFVVERVARALNQVDIASLAHAYPAQISGGQMQRAAIARAVIHTPSIVLADEPTGSLDSRNGEAVLRLLRSLADDGQALLVATHANEVVSACDRIIIVQDGRIVA